ncbi:MAG: HEPN domain-containing protein [Elusimicrobiota bacterium]|jgi:uncharacterized protein (UPF0332 family)|nr:HEPN domain-containing protein [Elusimicrobiota bacterium]
MPPPKDEIIKLAVEKSKKALNNAETNIKNSAFENALNRIYYAIFYIVLALAYKYDFRTSKHSALMSWFNKKFVYEDKIFDNKFFDTYEQAFEYRQRGDYDMQYTPDIETVNKLMSEAKVFVDTVIKVI